MVFFRNNHNDSKGKQKNEKTVIIHHFSPPSKVGTMRERKRKERATKEGCQREKEDKIVCFCCEGGVGKREWGLKLNKK